MQTEIDFTGKDLMEAGIDQAVSHADAVSPAWSDTAYAFLLEYAATEREFMAEDVRAAAAGKVAQPPSLRAWGGVMLRAAKAGLITKIGFRSVSNPKAHCATGGVWIFKK